MSLQERCSFIFFGAVDRVNPDVWKEYSIQGLSPDAVAKAYADNLSSVQVDSSEESEILEGILGMLYSGALNQQIAGKMGYA